MPTPAGRRYTFGVAPLLLAATCSCSRPFPARRRRRGGRHPRQRTARAPPRGPSQSGGRLPGVVPGGLAQRGARPHRPGPLPRAHDVQGHAGLRAAPVLAPGRAERRPGQRLHQPGRDRVLRRHRGGPPRPGDRPRGRPHAPSPPRAGRRRLRAPGRPRGAPDAHGRRSRRLPLGAGHRAGLHGASVQPAGDRLGRGRGADHARGHAGLLPDVLRAQQRPRGGGRATSAPRRSSPGSPSASGAFRAVPILPRCSPWNRRRPGSGGSWSSGRPSCPSSTWRTTSPAGLAETRPPWRSSPRCSPAAGPPGSIGGSSPRGRSPSRRAATTRRSCSIPTCSGSGLPRCPGRSPSGGGGPARPDGAAQGGSRDETRSCSAPRIRSRPSWSSPAIPFTGGPTSSRGSSCWADMPSTRHSSTGSARSPRRTSRGWPAIYFPSDRKNVGILLPRR